MKGYVTVAEFLENDGDLKQGRMLFNEDGNYSGKFNGVNTMNIPLVGIYNTPTSIHDVYVEIEVTPIYE